MSRLDRCHSIADLRRLAKRRLPWGMWEFLEGGSDDEWSLANNRRAFDRWALVPRIPEDVREIDLSCRVLGREVSLPVLLAPTGATRMYHACGEVGVARAAAAEGTLYALSTYSSHSLEQVAEACAGPRLFQLFVNPGVDRSIALVDRAQKAGYDALCLTVDTTAEPNKERDRRTGVSKGGATPRAIASMLAHPRWLAGFLAGGVPGLANFGVGVREAKAFQFKEASHLSWDVIARVRDRWSGPFALKGLFGPADAERALGLGVDGILLSNHGGRQLDATVAPLDLLPELVAAVGDRREILLDSGIRRGTDVVKALALGARAVLVGRAVLYGAAAGGEAGVARCLAILREELERDLRLLGVARVRELDASLVREVPPR